MIGRKVAGIRDHEAIVVRTYVAFSKALVLLQRLVRVSRLIVVCGTWLCGSVVGVGN